LEAIKEVPEQGMPFAVYAFELQQVSGISVQLRACVAVTQPSATLAKYTSKRRQCSFPAQLFASGLSVQISGYFVLRHLRQQITAHLYPFSVAVMHSGSTQHSVRRALEMLTPLNHGAVAVKART
jgi:hypothetical protein